MVLEKTLERPLDYKEIQSVHSEGDQPWDFFGRNDAKAETPVLWDIMRRVDPLEKTVIHGVAQSDMTERLNGSELKNLQLSKDLLHQIPWSTVSHCTLISLRGCFRLTAIAAWGHKESQTRLK